MISPPVFETLQQLESSKWLSDIKRKFKQDTWPQECTRCQETETTNSSIRQYSMATHDQNLNIRSDYLVLGGVLDNVCNSACQTCNENLSTKIGSLTSHNYIQINNSGKIEQLPTDRIIQMDINGGEPSASPNYLKLLDNLPPNVKHLRLNTNGSRVLAALPRLIERGVMVTVTVSLDGIERVHDYVRWPIKWHKVAATIQQYQNMGLHRLNTWTTVSALNIGDLKNIQEYTKKHNIDHSYALLEQPDVLSVKHSNYLTRTATVPDELKHIVAQGQDNSVALELFTQAQDQLRGIKIQDYYQ
jgi:sulfatase maturation enzyme AslB (radical SAM superfamily)